jgi:phosphoribosylaminoimidazole-succinocarboxamide synthase
LAKRSGTVCREALPAGLRQADKLPQTLFTPSTKAPQGEHDENISFAEAERLLGADVAAQVRDLSLAIYRFGADWPSSAASSSPTPSSSPASSTDKSSHR